MPFWPQQPIIYEINAWTWLVDLQRARFRKLTLADVPNEEWDRIAELGCDAVWLMGVWERSPAAREVSRSQETLQLEYRRQLADFRDEDVCGSPYSIHEYSVDPDLGGAAGLKAARAQLAKRNLLLVLDFVPNHVAPDHPWVQQHPEYFIRGSEKEAAGDEIAFFASGGRGIARGKDPYFSPWPDTAQLNSFDAGLRAAAQQTVAKIAEQCDGVRCDMAMLFINQIFAGTWGERAGAAPEAEYWPDVIRAARNRAPGFLFIAEAYWDLEATLMGLGFDYCYDKRLYDRLAHDSAAHVREHLTAPIAYQRHLLRFLENHDEPRCAEVFPPSRAKAASVVLMTLPGAKLVHEGQIEGYKIKHCVHLGRRAAEKADEAVSAFYHRLLSAVAAAELGHGTWTLCEALGWPDNITGHNLLTWGWQVDDRHYLVVINFSGVKSQARVPLPWPEAAACDWRLADQLSDRIYSPRSGGEMVNDGLFVDMDPWDFYFFALQSL